MPTVPEWVVTWPEVWRTAGALLVIAGGVWAVVRFVHPVMKRITLVLDLILGRPPQQGIEGQPSMVERIEHVAQDLAEVKAEVAEVKTQVKPNHGTSAHDKLSKEISAVQIEAQATKASVTRLTQVLTQQYGIQLDIDSGTPGV